MKLKNSCTIYLLTNKINGKVYVGQTWQKLQYRFGNNGQGYVECTYLNNAIKKYGWEVFKHQILCTTTSQEEANEKEDFFIKLFDSRNSNFGYNIKEGGSNGKLSKETKQKLSIIFKGENNPFFGKSHNNEIKSIISDTAKQNHILGLYDNKSENQKRFSDKEEKEIVMAYLSGNFRIQELLDKYNFSKTVFYKLKEKYGFKTIIFSKKEEHALKLRNHLKNFSKIRIDSINKNTEELRLKVVELRYKGLLQKEIGKILNISQVRVSQLLKKK